MCLGRRVRCTISLSPFPSVSVCWIRRFFLVFVVCFGTFSNVVVPRNCMDIVCRPPCDRPCAIAAAACIAVRPNPLVVVLPRTAARWCSSDVAMYTQTRWWWPSNGCCLLVRVLCTCVDLARRCRVHCRHCARRSNPLVVVLSRTAARWCASDVVMYTQTRRWWPSNGCCLLERVARTCVDLARRRPPSWSICNC